MKVKATPDGIFMELSEIEKRSIMSAVEMTRLTPREAVDGLAERYSTSFSLDIKQVVADKLAEGDGE